VSASARARLGATRARLSKHPTPGYTPGNSERGCTISARCVLSCDAGESHVNSKKDFAETERPRRRFGARTETSPQRFATDEPVSVLT